jgi:hypothetical protein
VNYPTGEKILCSTAADYYSDHGDSGSPVFIWDGASQVSFAGLNFGRGTYAYFSPLSQITRDLTSSMAITRGVNLSTPSLSGNVNGTHPEITWSSVSGATGYQLWRQVCVWQNFQCGSGSSNGLEYQGTVYGTSYLDASLNASAYNGGSVPSALQYGYIAYYMYAMSSYDVSQPSSIVYFTLAP